jgi:hypothetical protein
MNEKIRTILHTAWNEPRHFFFWLALVCVCGFAAEAACTGFAGTNLLVAMVALACTLGFLLSFTAFVLSWVPAIRRLLGRLLARRFLVLGCLITLVALFYAVENWHGRRAWQSFKQQREAQGERFEMASLMPPPVPPSQNFFETPLWSDLHFVRTNETVVWNDTNWGNHVVFNAFGPEGRDSPSTGNWTKGQRVDLAAWQSFYRGTNNLFAGKSGPPTNYFPIAKEPQSPAADVLLALSRFKENRQILVESATRPEARFWINYDAGPAMLLPHLARLKSSVQYLALHANAALKAGDKETAVQDLKLLFKLIEAIRNEPLLISHLVRIAATQIALQPVWEGLADHQWSETDLSLIETELGRLDWLADFVTCMHGEQACNLWAVDYIRKAGLSGWDQLNGSDHEGTTQGEIAKFLARAAFQFIPAGWFDQNKISTCRFHEEHILPALDQQKHCVSPGVVKASHEAIEKRKFSVYDAFSTLLQPSYDRAIERFARAQASTDLARIACALERYRLANGQFPDDLSKLAPKFIEKLPPDVIGGQPLKYRRSDDGNFVLYSVGWNESDDGGRVELTKQGGVDAHKGDWVWRYTAG